MYRDGEGWRDRLRVSTLHGVEALIASVRHLDQVADAVIEAGKNSSPMKTSGTVQKTGTDGETCEKKA